MVWSLGLWWRVEGNEIGTVYWGYIRKGIVPKELGFYRVASGKSGEIVKGKDVIIFVW